MTMDMRTTPDKRAEFVRSSERYCKAVLDVTEANVKPGVTAKDNDVFDTGTNAPEHRINSSRFEVATLQFSTL
jgi:hypothetical protein